MNKRLILFVQICAIKPIGLGKRTNFASDGENTYY